jgi:hypothetical protein
MTQTIDIFIEQGTDWSYDFPIDFPASLAGSAAALQIIDPDSNTYIATLTSANGGLVINAGSQTITASIGNALTSAFIPKDYIYDMKVSDNANKLYRPVEGNATVDRQVTTAALPVAANNPITTEGGLSIDTEDGQKITT